MLLKQDQLVEGFRGQSLPHSKCKQLIQGDPLEHGQAENLYHLVERGLQPQALPDDGHEHVDRDRDPDLSLDRIFRGPEERFDPQVLLDPLEEQLDLPATAIQLGDRQRGQGEVRGGFGKSDSVISGSLASPRPPRGGQREERGNETNETESRSDL